MPRFRQHRGGFDESMATTVEVADLAALYEHVSQLLLPYDFHFRPEHIHITPYEYDERNGWNTHIVIIEGYGVAGFLSGGLP